MNDVESQLKELLHERADAIRVDPEIPSRVLKRSRRRRAGGAALGATLAVAIVAAGFVGARALTGSEPARAPSGPAPAREWRGIWPQDTRQEAQEAQAAVDDGRGPTWQLRAAEVARRFALQHLGWEQAFVTDENLVAKVATIDEPIELHFNDCVPPELIEGAPPEGCRFRVVTLERLLRRDSTGLWFVTAHRDPIAELEEKARGDAQASSVALLVDQFMRARIAGAGAERFLTEDSIGMYEEHAWGLYLYDGDVQGGEPEVNYAGFAIESTVERADGTFDVLVRIDTGGFEGKRGSFAESLWIGRGLSTTGERLPFVIRSATRLGGDAPPKPPTPVRDMVTAFMEARLAEGSVNRFLTQDSEGQYELHEGGMYLYDGDHAEGQPAARYVGFEIVSIRFGEAHPYEVLVRIDFEGEDGSGGTRQEHLYVGRGLDLDDVHRDFLIRAAAAVD